MKKIVVVLIFWAVTAYAMEPTAIVLTPEARAYIELQRNLQTVAQDVRAARGSEKKVPDFFALTKQECVLPQVRECCKNALSREAFLNLVTDKPVRRALAKNCLAQLYKNQANFEELVSLGTTYNVMNHKCEWWVIEGQDMRSWNKALVLFSNQFIVGDASDIDVETI